MEKQHDDLVYGFNPYNLESVPHQKEQAIRELGYALAEKIQTGEKILVWLETQEPSEYQLHDFVNRGGLSFLYQQEPLFLYRLNFGIVHERVIEVPIWQEVKSYLAPMPDYRIEKTDTLPMLREILKRGGRKIKYHLRWWTAAKVNEDILKWRD